MKSFSLHEQLMKNLLLFVGGDSKTNDDQALAHYFARSRLVNKLSIKECTLSGSSSLLTGIHVN